MRSSKETQKGRAGCSDVHNHVQLSCQMHASSGQQMKDTTLPKPQTTACGISLRKPPPNIKPPQPNIKPPPPGEDFKQKDPTDVQPDVGAIQNIQFFWCIQHLFSPEMHHFTRNAPFWIEIAQFLRKTGGTQQKLGIKLVYGQY